MDNKQMKTGKKEFGIKKKKTLKETKSKLAK